MPSEKPSIEDIKTSLRSSGGAGPLTQLYAADLIDQLQEQLDAAKGMGWWNDLDDAQRKDWMARAGNQFAQDQLMNEISLDSYVTDGIMSTEQCSIIKKAIQERQNILIAGNGHSGKTTLANAIINYAAVTAPQQRFAVLEIIKELQCTAENVMHLRCVDYLDHVGMDQLIQIALSKSPDRLVMGELRDGSCHALFQAWNAGICGGVATIDANSAISALQRAEQLAGESSQEPVQTLVSNAVDLIILIAGTSKARRQIREIVKVESHDGNP